MDSILFENFKEKEDIVSGITSNNFSAESTTTRASKEILNEMIHSSSTNDIYSINNFYLQNNNISNNANNRSNSTGSQTLPVMLMQQSMMSSNSTSASGSGSLSPSSSVQNFSMLNDIYFHNSNNVNEILARHGTFSYHQSPMNNSVGSTTNIHNTSAIHNKEDMGSINMGFASMQLGDQGPKYDLELIAQTTKQEDSKFMGRKKRRNSSVSKVFLGDFLKLSLNVTILKMISKYGDNHILFSDVLVKVNKRNKMQERIVIITDKSLYNVHPTDYKLKRRISLENITSLSMSTLEDNFIIIHVNSEYDYVLVSSRKTELTTILVEAYYKLTFYQIQPLTIGPIPMSPLSTASSPLMSSVPSSPLSISMPTSSQQHNTNNSSGGSSGSNNTSPYPSPNSLFSVNHNHSNIPSPNQLLGTSYQQPSTTTPNNISNSKGTSRPQFLRSHSQSQVLPNLNISSPSTTNGSGGNSTTVTPPLNGFSSSPGSPQFQNIFIPNFSTSNYHNNNNNNIIIINPSANNNNNNSNSTTNNNTQNNNNNNNSANIVSRITGSILPVNFSDRIEYKTEGDSTREVLFNRVQGAVNITIQTVRNKTNTNKKEATRASIK
ncbi:hypothetical protein DLAC_08146 [Tieghemostelium lacteum]|uniref:TH1 domain-containing protein n=1 Tax=Tieghemostelium lacteum TaxID=361077 RepID=A0A151ZB97_TIELA|nr:hypothetical protein DLAC_08146 [Tieghemostelium lacteum]|eukprot:KYQ91220.1 hypothetical protein DLAC_08146 [Tieghemostelium lacteum]